MRDAKCEKWCAALHIIMVQERPSFQTDLSNLIHDMACTILRVLVEQHNTAVQHRTRQQSGNKKTYTHTIHHTIHYPIAHRTDHQSSIIVIPQHMRPAPAPARQRRLRDPRIPLTAAPTATRVPQLDLLTTSEGRGRGGGGGCVPARRGVEVEEQEDEAVDRKRQTVTYE